MESVLKRLKKNSVEEGSCIVFHQLQRCSRLYLFVFVFVFVFFFVFIFVFWLLLMKQQYWSNWLFHCFPPSRWTQPGLPLSILVWEDKGIS